MSKLGLPRATSTPVSCTMEGAPLLSREGGLKIAVAGKT